MVISFIKRITVKPFERKDRHIWYPLQVELDNHDTIEVKRRYSDFLKFSEQLQFIDKTAPKMSRRKSWIKRYSHRQVELETFCKHLVSLPSVMTRSDIYLGFFNLDEEERIRIKLVYDSQNILVLRVYRSVSFDTLKAMIIQRFGLSSIPLSNHLALLAFSPACFFSAITVVSNESQWKQALQTQWSHLPKVTVRLLSI
ncbi:unnamed protein product [Rhizopus stolonifer]